MVNDEQFKKYAENASVKEIMQGGKNNGENSFRSQILAQDQYKQEVIDGLLRIRRKTVPMETNEGEMYFQEFVRLEDGSGQWKKVSNITDKEWEELKKGGVINEEGAKDILTHLNAISNNHVSLSNLTKDNISTIGRESELSLTQKLVNNREKYDIDSPDDIEWVITSIVRPPVMAGLSKSKNGSFAGELLRETKLVGSLDDEEEESSSWTANLTRG